MNFLRFCSRADLAACEAVCPAAKRRSQRKKSPPLSRLPSQPPASASRSPRSLASPAATPEPATATRQARAVSNFHSAIKMQSIDYTRRSFSEHTGRRVNTFDPDRSLLLAKPLMSTAHEGGQRFTTDSPEANLLRRWIAAGAPNDPPNTPRVKSIRVTPDDLILPRARRPLSIPRHRHVQRWHGSKTSPAGPATIPSNRASRSRPRGRRRLCATARRRSWCDIFRPRNQFAWRSCHSERSSSGMTPRA